MLTSFIEHHPSIDLSQYPIVSESDNIILYVRMLEKN